MKVKKRNQPKVIGIVGSRRRDDEGALLLLLNAFREHYTPGDTLVSGGCPKGGDRFAELIAKQFGLTLVIHFPDWDGPDGKAAGFVRNGKIAKDCDILLALPSFDRTGGTEDTIKKALKLKKKVILV